MGRDGAEVEGVELHVAEFQRVEGGEGREGGEELFRDGGGAEFEVGEAFRDEGEEWEEEGREWGCDAEAKGREGVGAEEEGTEECWRWRGVFGIGIEGKMEVGEVKREWRHVEGVREEPWVLERQDADTWSQKMHISS